MNLLTRLWTFLANVFRPGPKPHVASAVRNANVRAKIAECADAPSSAILADNRLWLEIEREKRKAA